MNERSENRRCEGALEFNEAGKTPHASIHAEKREYQDAKGNIWSEPIY